MQENGWKARLSSCSSMAMPIVISSHNVNTADASASTAASSSIWSVKKKKSSRKRKIKASVHITSDQNLEETRNKEIPFPNNYKMNNQWAKYSHGYYMNRKQTHCYKTIASRGGGMWFVLLKLLHGQICGKKVTGWVARNVMSGSKRQYICGRRDWSEQHTAKKSELYLRRYIFLQM